MHPDPSPPPGTREHPAALPAPCQPVPMGFLTAADTVLRENLSHESPLPWGPGSRCFLLLPVWVQRAGRDSPCRPPGAWRGPLGNAGAQRGELRQRERCPHLTGPSVRWWGRIRDTIGTLRGHDGLARHDQRIPARAPVALRCRAGDARSSPREPGTARPRRGARGRSGGIPGEAERRSAPGLTLGTGRQRSAAVAERR